MKTRDMAMGDRRDASSGGGAHVLDAKLKLICMGCTKRRGGGGGAGKVETDR